MSCSMNLNFCPYNLLLYPLIHLLTLLLYLQLFTSWLLFIICHNLPSHHLVLPLPPHLLFLLFLVLSHQLLMHANPIPEPTLPNHTPSISPHAGPTPEPTSPNHTLPISPIDRPLSPSTHSTHLVHASIHSLQPQLHSLPPTTNTHPMTTRSKNDIFKPEALATSYGHNVWCLGSTPQPSGPRQRKHKESPPSFMV